MLQCYLLLEDFACSEADSLLAKSDEIHQSNLKAEYEKDADNWLYSLDQMKAESVAEMNRWLLDQEIIKEEERKRLDVEFAKNVASTQTEVEGPLDNAK